MTSDQRRLAVWRVSFSQAETRLSLFRALFGVRYICYDADDLDGLPVGALVRGWGWTAEQALRRAQTARARRRPVLVWNDVEEKP